ncbi:hypothetical protein [Streptomyces sp. NPDC058066]|uniref:hypothetical protein n=1 Tax=Streptomyces sp. NPDC058066 TaxID=3346323 RepID=UPI0036EFA1B2
MVCLNPLAEPGHITAGFPQLALRKNPASALSMPEHRTPQVLKPKTENSDMSVYWEE